MARDCKPLTNERYAELEMKAIQVVCPICGELFKTWYCHNCGLPKNNSSYCMYNNAMYQSCSSHFRQGVGALEDYQLCGKCYSPNPFNVKYCKSCSADITKQARDKHGHGWVDLGLSVLWSTEALQHRFRWNDYNVIDSGDRDEYYRKRQEYRSSLGKNGKDAATCCWGDKWRTPTKEEFEELITKCKWKTCIVADSVNPYALKVTGPNRNSIIIPVYCHDLYYGNPANFSISFWTSTSSRDEEKAYSFRFYQEIERTETLTARQKKWSEFYELNEIRFKVELTNEEFRSVKLGDDYMAYTKLKEEKRRKTFPQYETTLEQQRKILEAMGDDSQERRDNKKKDKEKFDNLWLKTPIKISATEDVTNGTIGLVQNLKIQSRVIRPVADKKWKGKL